MEIMQDLQEWFMANRVDKALFARDAAENQIMFVRDRINNLMMAPCEDQDIIKVCGEHRSKSAKLPVYYFELPQHQIKFCFRGNFYNWNLAVESDTALTCNFLNLFPEDDTYYCYYEGFPQEFIFKKSFKDDPKRFNCYVSDDYDLYCFFRVIRNHFEI